LGNKLARFSQNRLPALWQAPPGETDSAEALDKLKILSQRKEIMDNPKRFDDTNYYAGSGTASVALRRHSGCAPS
jgi:hypothetical protein